MFLCQCCACTDCLHIFKGVCLQWLEGSVTFASIFDNSH